MCWSFAVEHCRGRWFQVYFYMLLEQRPIKGEREGETAALHEASDGHEYFRPSLRWRTSACHLFTAAALLAQLDRDGALITWSQALHSIHPQQCRSLMVVTVSSVFLSDDQMKYYWQLCTRTHAHKGMWSWPPHTARGHIRINYFMEVPA